MAWQLARAALGWMGTAGHLFWPSLMELLLHRWSWRIQPVAFPCQGLSADVIQLPVMTVPNSVFQSAARSELCKFRLSLSIGNFFRF